MTNPPPTSPFEEELRKANEAATASVFEAVRLSQARAADVPSKDATVQEKAREIIPNLIPHSSTLIAAPEPRLSMTMGPTGPTVGKEDAMDDDISWFASGGGGGVKADPFDLTFTVIPSDPPGDDPTYTVAVGWGYVLERISDTDPIVYHLPDFLDTALPIVVDTDAVYVKINLKPDGSIGFNPDGIPLEPAVAIVVDVDGISSLEPTGSAYGYHYIKLGKPIQPPTPPGDDTPPVEIEPWLTGSHIEHFVGGVGGGETAEPVPLQVTLTKTDGIWNITVAYGHVVPVHNARATIDSDDTDKGTPVDIGGLPISTPEAALAGMKFWVKRTVSSEGKVTFADWESGDDWEQEEAPILDGGDTTPAQGYRYTRIAEIVADGDNLAVKQLHTGHIDHVQPTLSENTITSATTDQGRVLQKWDEVEGKYKFRYIEAGGGIAVTENADSILIEGAAGVLPLGTADGQILYWDQTTEVWKRSVEPSEHAIPFWDVGTKAYKWVIAGSNEEYLNYTGAGPVWELTPTTDVVQITPTAQVHVASVVDGPSKTTTYTVRGNSVDKTLRYKVGSDSAVAVAEFKDGLLTDEISGAYIDILIPAAGGAGLPSGTYTGDLLVWVAETEEWVVLPAPVAPAAGEKIFITHSGRGDYPEFLTLKELEVDICESGVPTPYKIYGSPNPPPP